MSIPSEFTVVRRISDMQEISDAWRARGETVALVPTMGFLHEGHLSLVEMARSVADRVVTSIYVNPTQFGPEEDLDAYPRDEVGDLAKLAANGVDLAFLPSTEEMYPRGAQTFVELKELPHHLCGLSRPSHFRGVATICTKLFNAVRPHAAIFGEKDYQQLLVLRKMATDLLLPIEIIGAPIIREPDGLARSSRNVYLSEEDRKRALSLFKALRHASDLAEEGEQNISLIQKKMREIIEANEEEIDYVAIVDAETLEPLETGGQPARALVAVRYGKARLIDNMALYRHREG